MIENIIITTLLVLFVDVLMDKLGFYFKLENYGRKSRFKFIYKLVSCEFCMMFHFGWILFVLVSVFNFYNITYILTPFCVSGAIKLIRS